MVKRTGQVSRRAQPRGFAMRGVWVIMVLVTLACIVGCSDSRFDQESAVRRKRREAHLHELAERERRCPENIRDLQATHERALEHRREHLERTRDMLHERVEQESFDWRRFGDQRQSYVRKQLRGKPETIRDTWAAMIY